ncbi:MAG: SbcC/MukB-like Walker B domain-containing protein [Chloroherpetonaceae bacterium]
MIPKKLRLRNFLSYGEPEQELDFDLFQFAVLTGENGAGKSSLIEAIPFCIWGKGRESNHELVRKGAKEARIELELELQNNIYRITRILRKNKSQQLEFAVYDRSINDFRTLTCKHVKDTEAEIQKRIGISYETFINSAFFAQGKADLFFRNGPTERRKVLSEILGLSHYEELSKKAKEVAKSLQGKLVLTLTRISLLKSDIASLPQLRLDYDAKLAEEHAVKAELATLEDSLLALTSDLEAFKQKESELAVLNAELNSLKQRLEQEARLVRQKESEVSAIDLRLQTRETLLLKQQQSESLKKELELLDERQSLAQSLKEQISKLENDYNAKRAKLEAEKKSAQGQLAQLNQMIAQRQARLERKAKLLQEHPQIQSKLDALKKECARLPEVESLLNATRTKVSDLRSAIASAQMQMDAISEKGKKVKELSDTCPLCQSHIEESHKEHILQNYRDEYRAYQVQKKHHEDTLQVLQQELSQYEQELAALKQKEREQNKCAIELNQITTEMASLQEVERELKQIESDKIVQEAKAKDAELELHALAQAKAEIEKLQAELSAIGYDAQLHQRKKSELKSFDSIERELAALESDEKRRNVLLQEISEHRQTYESLVQQHALKEENINALRKALIGKAELEMRLQTVSNEKREKTTRLQEVSSKCQALKFTIDEKEEKEKTMKELEQEIGPEKETIELYEILAEAYSVKGVQQLLLEKAIPEIERLANELLAQLTNNSFSLSLQTERQTQNNTVEQTLAIIISDANANTRLYETFSGGERFRIDFALRLALSKYLSNISGTPIKMIVIDEGFGTQDQNGIEAMIEAMNQVCDDFEKLILITHLEEMKDAFPTRIVVSKDHLKGSRFEVIS